MYFLNIELLGFELAELPGWRGKYEWNPVPESDEAPGDVGTSSLARLLQFSQSMNFMSKKKSPSSIQ